MIGRGTRQRLRRSHLRTGALPQTPGFVAYRQARGRKDSGRLRRPPSVLDLAGARAASQQSPILRSGPPIVGHRLRDINSRHSHEAGVDPFEPN